MLPRCCREWLLPPENVGCFVPQHDRNVAHPGKCGASPQLWGQAVPQHDTPQCHLHHPSGHSRTHLWSFANHLWSVILTKEGSHMLRGRGRCCKMLLPPENVGCFV